MRREKLAYTVEETAEMLSLSRAHIYRLLDQKQLNSIQVGRSRRIMHSQLEEFLRSLEQNEKPFPRSFL
jgi:excisionase family DNA binding protein